MKRLNNKGITTIEIILCFLLVSIIATSLFQTISAYNQIRLNEGYKSEINSYKNMLTKLIQDDIINKELSSVDISKRNISSDTTITDKVLFTFKDGEKTALEVKRRYTKSTAHPNGNAAENDNYEISYGNCSSLAVTANDITADKCPDMIKYPLPDLGETSVVIVGGKIIENTEELGKLTQAQLNTLHKAKNLSISNVLIDEKTKNEDGGNVFSLHIGFYHPDLDDKYGINIVSPIDFDTNS